MFEDLWLKLGGEKLRLTLNQILYHKWKGQPTMRSVNNIHWAIRDKTINDIHARH